MLSIVKPLTCQKNYCLKTVLLIGAGKSATVLINYLLKETELYKWKFIIADANKEQVLAKTNNSRFAEVLQLDITNDKQREKIIQRAHVVISMMPPSLHFLIAKDCVELRKHLLTASYMDDQMKSLKDEIHHRKLLFLCEMGLDPGIDHMSAMKIIHELKAAGAKINSFKSHCGGLVAPDSDNNPWHYKISWNPRNVVMAGSAGAEFRLNGEKHHLDYERLFDNAETVTVDGLDPLAFYPNRDSLSYIPVYKLPEAANFIRTTLRYPAFFIGWNAIVNAGLTNDSTAIDVAGLSFAKWSEPVLPFVNENNQPLLAFLGFFDEEPVPAYAKTSADILQFLLETKLAMAAGDKDMVVMLHEFEYELKGQQKFLQSSLVVKGEDNLQTAMAKTVGLPLGIAASLLLNDELKIRGLYIPIVPDIYEPVLKELEAQGIQFVEKRS